MSSRELKFLIQPNGDIHSRVNDRHRSTSSVNEEKHISEFAFNKKKIVRERKLKHKVNSVYF